MLSDKELIEQFYQGNQKAFEELFLRYKLKIFNFSLRVCGNRSDSEDVVNEVFMQIFRRKYRMVKDIKFSTWLFTITRNFCISRIRKRFWLVSFGFVKDDQEKEYDPMDNKPNPADELEKKEEKEFIRKAILKLPLNQRQALVLRQYQELRYEEIATIMDCSLENIKILIYRARESLKKILEPLLNKECHG